METLNFFRAKLCTLYYFIILSKVFKFSNVVFNVYFKTKKKFCNWD